MLLQLAGTATPINTANSVVSRDDVALRGLNSAAWKQASLRSPKSPRLTADKRGFSETFGIMLPA
jgi:hypothetical protein